MVTRASIAIASLSRVKGNATWLGPSGACDALMAVMGVHQADLAVSKFIISAMGNLCIIDNNRERLGTLGACESIVSSAKMHMLDLDTAKAASLAMGKLCEHIYRATGDTEESLMHAASANTSGGDGTGYGGFDQSALQQQQGSGGVSGGGGDSTFDLISSRHNSLSTALQVAQAAEMAAAAVAAGVVPPIVVPARKESDLLSFSDVTASAGAAADSSGRNTPMVGGGGGSGGGSGTTSPIPMRSSQLSPVAQAHAMAGRRNRARLFDSDYCAVLVSLLSNHITDADAVRIISRTISIIAFGDACSAERDVLATVGACKALAKAMQYHEGDESIGRGVCWAIKALAYHNHHIREELRTYGVCVPVLVVLRGFRYSKNAVETVQGAAAAIANMCQDNVGNKAAMGAAGACEGLLEVMELHYRNIEVAYLCAKALFHVCDGNHENRLKISFSGAADILMSMITRYTDEDRILDYVFSIMIGMCLGKVGQSRLGTVGAAKAVVSALYRYEKSSEYIVLLCCTLIHSLAQNSADNQTKLGAAGAVKAIASIAARYVRSQTFNTTNLKIIQLAAMPRPVSDSKLDAAAIAMVAAADAEAESTAAAAAGETSSLGASVDATAHLAVSKEPLAEIIGEFSVMKECCKAIVHMSTNNDANKAKFQVTNALDTLTPVLSTAVPYNNNGTNGNISLESLKWVKCAVDVLMGKL